MNREDVADLAAFVVVVEEGSFTRAAPRLGVTQSAVSQIVRRLEGRLGVRLLARTTRSVAPTEAGERLSASIGPMFREMDQSIAELSEFRDKPAGTVRITTVEHAAKTILLPKLSVLLEEYPDIKVEIVVDHGLSDIVADRYDAGVRLGEQVALDMVAVRLSPDVPMAVVGSPDYLETHKRPRTARDLLEHRCINLKLPTSGAVIPWRATSGGEDVRVRVAGPLAFNTIDLIRDAALAGCGLAYLPLDQVERDVETGALEKVLDGKTSPLPGYYLYYPDRRHLSPAFKLIVDCVRYRPDERRNRKGRHVVA